MTAATREELEQIGTLIKGSKIAILTTENEEGRLVSRPLATVGAEFDGTVWFFTPDDSEKVSEIRRNREVNVSYESGKGWLSLSGTAELVHDRAKIDEYWTKEVEAWFDQGKDDPTVALLKVTAHSAEYWASVDPKPVVLLKYAKAIATGGHPDIGENRVVDL
ncbi:MAG TPA: pyridoxamine 5'-phosphate oxidase family protein [Naasia sp.]|jgi:general stress protein 26